MGTDLKIAAMVACVLFLNSCYYQNSDAVTTKCDTSARSTLLWRWEKTPIPVSISSESGFSDYEKTLVQAAITNWNRFYTASRGFPVFEFVGTSAGATPSSGSLCGSGILQGGQYTGSVVISKITQNWTYGSSVIAQTQVCSIIDTQSTTALNRAYMAVMYLNFQHFFVTGTRLPDFESIMTHELGHLFGLGHSCEYTTRAGFPNCTGATSAQTSALMFPATLFPDKVNGEVRKSIRVNDQQRANCIYDK